MKRTFLTAGVLISLALIPITMYLVSPNYDSLNPVHRYVATSIVDKWTQYEETVPRFERATLDIDTLLGMLNFYEGAFARRIFRIRPDELGFMGKFYSLDKPTDLIKIDNVVLEKSPNHAETGVQYYPRHAFKDYREMMASMQTTLGRRLYIDSGYRSPGRQAYLFFYYLVKTSDFVLMENARWIAMPGFSEHGSPLYTAIDFISEEGINGFSEKQTAEDFEKLEEYKWLQQNAARFNFYLSYPRENIIGVAFEPWHWHWEGDTSIFSSANTPQIGPNP
ncbi:MAG: D-alanyl-D-alanine carboxypeptidase family protein [Ignavibacteriaceae bacterium]|nr:D-alanyl-D-alanine carboxypeptidase family protein [Ignavibacteriaceae bacterium]